jgi:hypothetical protein
VDKKADKVLPEPSKLDLPESAFLSLAELRNSFRIQPIYNAWHIDDPVDRVISKTMTKFITDMEKILGQKIDLPNRYEKYVNSIL